MPDKRVTPVESSLVLPGRVHRHRDDNVRPLTGATRGELAIEDLRRAIHDGELRPGQALSLRSLAEERRVRLPVLTMLVERLRRERLLEIRGDVAIVAPLDPDALTSAFRLGDLVAPAMVSRALTAITTPQLHDFANLYPSDGVLVRSVDVDEHLRALAEMPLRLMTLDAESTDRYVLKSIDEFTWRYLMLSQRSLPDPDNSPWAQFLWGYRNVIELLGEKNVYDATVLLHSLNQEHQDFVRLCLDRNRGSDDDYPVAQVIPINRARATPA